MGRKGFEPCKGDTAIRYPLSVIRIEGRVLPAPGTSIRGFDQTVRIGHSFRNVPLEKLSRARILEALNLLGRLAEQEGVTLELCLYGGAALMLAYGARDSTKDLDVIAHPSDVTARLAQSVAADLGLDESWLNDSVRQFVSDLGTFAPLEIHDLEATAKQRLRITRPSASYLLAMKCMAGRSALPGYAGDVADIRFLIQKMGIRTLTEIEAHMDRYYPRDPPTPRARELLAGLLSEARKGEA